jgi:hypothetical protein
MLPTETREIRKVPLDIAVRNRVLTGIFSLGFLFLKVVSRGT